MHIKYVPKTHIIFSLYSCSFIVSMPRIYILYISLNRKYIKLQYAVITPYEIVPYSVSVHKIAISEPRTTLRTTAAKHLHPMPEGTGMEPGPDTEIGQGWSLTTLFTEK